MNDHGAADTRPKRFILRLYKILNDPSNKNVAEWTQSGQSFEIHNIGLFFKKILPRFYKNKKLNRLIRLLKLYNFNKMNCENRLVYCHHDFIRGKDERLERITKRSVGINDLGLTELISKSLELIEKVANLKSETKVVSTENNMIIEHLRQKVATIHVLEALICHLINNPERF